MKVKALATYPQLDGIFKKGDVLEFTVQKYEKDTVIVNEGYGHFGNDGVLRGLLCKGDLEQYENETGLSIPPHIKKISKPVIAPKGSYKGYIITNKEGKTYSDKTISGAVGPTPLSRLFEKFPMKVSWCHGGWWDQGYIVDETALKFVYREKDSKEEHKILKSVPTGSTYFKGHIGYQEMGAGSPEQLYPVKK